jgi:hypothetical protein
LRTGFLQGLCTRDADVGQKPVIQPCQRLHLTAPQCPGGKRAGDGCKKLPESTPGKARTKVEMAGAGHHG